MPDPVLVVAADLHFAKVIERACNAHGLEAISADEGESALVALEFEKPIAVVLENDLRGDRTGMELAKEMRERPEGEALPIILLAGGMMTAAELAPKAVDAGVTCCLDSTVDPASIAAGIRALLEGDDSILYALVNGLPVDGPRAAPAPKPEDKKPEERKKGKTGGRQPAPDTRVRETDDEPLKKGQAPPEGPAGSGIEIEVDDRAFTSAKTKSPPAAPRPKHPPAKARSGSLTTIAFGRLLADLHQDLASGSLDLVREKVKKTIWLLDGVPIAAKSNAMGETLGAVLVKMGKITEAQRAESIDKMQKEKKRHGEVLVEMGLARQKDVNSALQAQARAKVINCFAWDDGSYDFKPSTDLPPEQPELKMSFGALIAAGVKQRYDLPRLRKALLPHIGETPRFDDSAAELLATAKLPEAEQKILESLRGRRSLAEVLALSEMDELQLHRALVTALFMGAVKFLPEGNETRQYRMAKENPGAAKVGPAAPPPPKDAPPPPRGAPPPPAPRDAPPPPSKSGGKIRVPEDPAYAKTGPKLEVTEPEPSKPPEPADPAIVARVTATLNRLRGQNHYDRLGVATDAQLSAIKGAYLRLAKEFHPDRLVQDGGDAIKSKADELFAMISDAYHTLGDEAKRKKYDDETLRGVKDDATDEANSILNAEHQFLKGERLLKAGNIGKAHEAFGEAVKLYPKESEYQACFGWTTFKLNHPGDTKKADEGEKIVKTALTMNARNDKAHYFLGQIAKTKGNLDEAKKHFEKALEIQPENIDAQRELRVMDMRDSKKGSGIGGLFRGKK